MDKSVDQQILECAMEVGGVKSMSSNKPSGNSQFSSANKWLANVAGTLGKLIADAAPQVVNETTVAQMMQHAPGVVDDSQASNGCDSFGFFTDLFSFWEKLCRAMGPAGKNSDVLREFTSRLALTKTAVETDVDPKATLKDWSGLWAQEVNM